MNERKLDQESFEKAKEIVLRNVKHLTIDSEFEQGHVNDWIVDIVNHIDALRRKDFY